MKIYILTERAKSNGQYHDRIVGCYEDYNYAVIEKAKREQSSPLNTFYINNQDLQEGTINTWEEDGKVSLKNDEFDTVAVVDYELEEHHFQYEKDCTPSGVVIWENTTKWEVEDISIFGAPLDELDLTEDLVREITNVIENEVELKNEQL
jgi:hypothetical protein